MEIRCECREKNQHLYVNKNKDVMRMEKVFFLFCMRKRRVERFSKFKLSLHLDDDRSTTVGIAIWDAQQGLHFLRIPRKNQLTEDLQRPFYL